MGRRGRLIVLAVLAILFLATVLPPLSRFLPIANVATGGDGNGPPESDIAPLGEFTPTQIVEIAYTTYLHGRGGGGDEGDGPDDVGARGLGISAVGALGSGCGKVKDWTELFYRTASDMPWALYAPPWNACGRWLGTRSEGVVKGTIPFDSLFTGGEGPYQFATVGVRHIHEREPLPDAEKARTTVDYHAPTLFIASPVAEAWTNRDLFRWDAQDTISGVDEVSLSVDDSNPIALGAASGTKALGVAEGTHTILVAATDRAGNRAEVRLSFHFDPTAPTLEFTAPGRDTFVRATDLSLTWTAQSLGAPLTTLRLSLDTEAPIDLPTNATSHALTGLAERRHVASLLAIDAAGNIATDSLPFGVDVSPPTVTVVEPRPYVNSRDLRVFWVATDNASGIDRSELSLDGGSAIPVGDVAGYQFPQIAEGPHTVLIRTFDRAGNVRQTTRAVTVDRTPPTVSLTEPKSGETYYGSIHFAWIPNDDRSGIDPDQTYFVYDEIGPALAVGTMNATVKPTRVGPHFALVRVMDRAGNPAEAGWAFAYGGPTAPGPLGLSAVDFSLLILVILAIAVVSAYVAVRRRRRTRAP